MNATSVEIEDDDVVLVDSTEVIDIDSKDESSVRNTSEDRDTIILDEEATTTSEYCNINNSDKDKDFAMSLKNNTLMNKIVHKCLNMPNNSGMLRVINKTLQPLYKDADTKFKQSQAFTDLLNKILHNLKHDPDHKFLHIKSLCEELKAGKYRRKVPFITLTTDLKRNNPKRSCRSKKKLKEKFNRLNMSKMTNANNKRKITNVNNETDIIDLGNSDDEPVITLIDDDNDSNKKDESDHIDINAENDDNDKSEHIDINAESDHIDKVDKSDHSVNHGKSKHLDNNAESDHSDKNDESIDNHKDDNSDENDDQVDRSNDNDRSDDNDVIMIVDDTRNSDAVSDQSNKENCMEKENINTKQANNIENTNTTNVNEEIPDYDLLIPHNSLTAKKRQYDLEMARLIEQQISFYKNQINLLETAEVDNNSINSPYVLLDKYKANVVMLYKEFCRLTGSGDGNLLKQRVVRLRVVDGHPPGPVQRLEKFLNSTIDETGAVPLPDFHDVFACVRDSNTIDKLGWSNQEMMKEAVALFTHCGKALKKQRQKREYKDLMSLVQDREIDADDPAARDPQLLARLEHNKLIARAKEEEVINSYVRKQELPNNSGRFEQNRYDMTYHYTGHSDSKDSDSESESNPYLTPRKKANTKDDNIHITTQSKNNITQNDVTSSSSENVEENSITSNDSHQARQSTPNINQSVYEPVTSNEANTAKNVTEATQPTNTINQSVNVSSTTSENEGNTSMSASNVNKAKKGININPSIYEAFVKSRQGGQGPVTVKNILKATQSIKKYNRESSVSTNNIQQHITYNIIKYPPIQNVTPPNNQNTSIEQCIKNATPITSTNVVPYFVDNITVARSLNTIYSPSNTGLIDNVNSIQSPSNTSPICSTNTVNYLINNAIDNIFLCSGTESPNVTTVESSLSAIQSCNNTANADNTRTLQKMTNSHQYVITFNSEYSSTEKNGDNVLTSPNIAKSADRLEPSIKKEPIDNQLHYDSTKYASTLQVEDNASTNTTVENNANDRLEQSIKEESIIIPFGTRNSITPKDEPISSPSDPDNSEKTFTFNIENNASRVPEIEENSTVKLEPKPEPIDIPRLLDELGDNYIATIFDIEDPFLVIEVSDSSDDDDL